MNELMTLSDRELIYRLINKENYAEKVFEDFQTWGSMDVSYFLEWLTPAKRKFAAEVIEMYRRMSNAQSRPKKITSSRNAFEILYNKMAFLDHEEIYVIFLNMAANVIKVQRFFEGGIASVNCDIRLILAAALKYRATGMILAHNHPSGNLQPSKEDDNLTKKLKEAAKTLDIRLLDHIIITQSDYFSYTDESHFWL